MKLKQTALQNDAPHSLETTDVILTTKLFD